MTFRWGILGAARIASTLIPAIRAAGGEVVLVGARDPQGKRVRDFAASWNIPHIGSYDDVISAELGAVYIPLPNHLHRPWGEAAMRAGKHVLIEKPLSLNAAEAQELERVAQETGRVLLEAFAYRFAPQTLAVMQAVKGGELGEVRLYRGSFGFLLGNPDDFRWDPAMGGGSLYDVGCYPVNLARLLLGEPLGVSAQARFTQRSVDTALSGLLDYGPSGALVSIDSAFDWAPGDMIGRCEIVGSGGHLELERAFDSNTADFRLTVNGQVRHVEVGNGYIEMIRHFQAAALGQEALRYAPADSVGQARVMDALLLSAREKRRVGL